MQKFTLSTHHPYLVSYDFYIIPIFPILNLKFTSYPFQSQLLLQNYTLLTLTFDPVGVRYLPKNAHTSADWVSRQLDVAVDE